MSAKNRSKTGLIGRDFMKLGYVQQPLIFKQVKDSNSGNVFKVF